MMKKEIIIIISFLLILLVVGLCFKFFYKKNNNIPINNATTQTDIFENLITDISLLSENETLYAKITNDMINVRSEFKAGYENKIGEVYKDDIYLVKDIHKGETMFWYLIEDANKNEGYIASGNPDIYLETLIKDKDNEIELSKISNYTLNNSNNLNNKSIINKSNKSNNSNENTNNNQLTIEYNESKSVSTFNFFKNNPNALITVKLGDYIISPDKIIFTCMQNNNEVNCNSLDENKNYTLIVKITYKGDSKSINVSLKGNNTNNSSNNNQNDNSTNNSSNNSQNDNGTNNLSNSNQNDNSTNNNTNADTNKELRVYPNFGVSYRCTNNGCGNYILFEISVSGGTKPYKYSICAYKDSTKIQCSNTSSIYLTNKKGNYNFKYMVTDANNAKITDSKLYTYN